MDLAERTLSRMAQEGKSPVYVGGVRFLLARGSRSGTFSTTRWLRPLTGECGTSSELG